MSQAQIQRSEDSFEKVVLSVIGKCHTNQNYPDVIQTTQDYIWFKLSQIPDPENLSHNLLQGEPYTLDKLQSKIRESEQQFLKQPQISKQMLYFQALFF